MEEKKKQVIGSVLKINNIMNYVLLSILFALFIFVFLSCQNVMNDVVNIKVKISKISFCEDIFDNGQTVACEEVVCEYMDNSMKKSIIIINYDYDKMKSLKENQQVEIGVRKTAWDLNNDIIQMNEVVYIKPCN